MNRRINTQENSSVAAWARRAATVGAVLAGGLGIALGAFAAPLPDSPTTATPYSWPTFHAGGAPGVAPTAGTGGPLVPYNQLQGTPSGVGSTAGASTEIPSYILGNYNPLQPPGSGSANGFSGTAPNLSVNYFPNHFYDGPLFQPHYFQLTAPLSFTLPSGTATTAAPAGPYADVQCSPTAVNANEYPEIQYMFYTGVAASGSLTNLVGNGTSQGAPAPVPGTGTPPGLPLVTTGTNAIRQVVYFGRTETVPVILDVNGNRTVGGVPAPAGLALGTSIRVGAVYAVDGFTGGVIWRYQTPAFYPASAANPNSFSTNVSGVGHTATNTGAQPFQVGPDAHDATGAITDTATNPALAGSGGFAPGTFSGYTRQGVLPASPTNGFQFALYAKTDVAGPNNTANFTGTFRIFPKSLPTNKAADDVNIVAHGSFTITATYDLVNHPAGDFANVNGTFSPDANSSYPFNPGLPARFIGTFDSTSGTLNINGTLATIPGGGSGNVLRDGAVLSSLSVARVNVTVPTGYPGTASGSVATKLVVVAADNNGYVYCLDALGNGYRDPAAAANSNIIYQNTASGSPNYDTDPNANGQVHYDYQPTYAGFTANAQPHVGTTFPYWIYRPDAAHPVLQSGETAADPNRDLPVPGAFNLASPTLYINPTVPVEYTYATGKVTDFGTLAPGKGPDAYTPPAPPPGGLGGGGGGFGTNTTVYIGNSNGVLYAFDAVGGIVPTAAAFNPAITNATPNVPAPAIPGIDDTTLTCNPKWWFAAYGINTSGATANLSIESAPAVLDQNSSGKPVVYVGTTLNTTTVTDDSSGHLYALDGNIGPVGNGGKGSAVPGSPSYNVNPQPIWGFPKAPAEVGDISGSPVVFANPTDKTPRIYFAADTAAEVVAQTGGNQTTQPSTTSGRIWCVNLDGTYNFAFPHADDPGNNPGAAQAPLDGGFLHATPAVGVVQYPQTINYLDVNGVVTAWDHADSQRTTLRGANVPMLYVGTTGDAASLIYMDLDGNSDAQREVYSVQDPSGVGFQSSPVLVVNSPNPLTGGAVGTGSGGSLFVTAGIVGQSTTTSTSGSATPTTIGSQLYQFQATPTTNSALVAAPAVPGPTVRQDTLGQTLVGGPFSAPAVCAAQVSDISSLQPDGTTISAESVTDWVYVGNSGDGLLYGYTPRGFGTDTTGGYLPRILPPQPPATIHTPVVNQFPIRTFLADSSPTSAYPANSTDMNKAYPVEGNLPVFEWGQTVFFRFANVVPPGVQMVDPTDPTGHHYFLANSTLSFTLQAVNRAGTLQANTNTTLSVPFVLLNPASNPAPDISQQNGFIVRSDKGTTVTSQRNTSELDGTSNYKAPETELLDANGDGYIAAGAYDIGFADKLDPGGLQPDHHNTPGYRRRVVSVSQNLTRYDSTGADPPTQVILSLGGPSASFSYRQIDTAPLATDPTNGTGNTGNLYIDQPTFGILNPLAIRGAGVSLNASPNGGPASPKSPWVDTTGHEGVGPFMGVDPAAFTAGAGNPIDLEALANGNQVFQKTPPSGVLTVSPDPTKEAENRAAFNNTYLPYQRYVIVTTTGQVGHGTTGDNTSPYSADALPLTVNRTGAGVSTLPPDAGYGPYTMNIADRSRLGTLPLTPGVTNPVLGVRFQSRDLGWNDNSPNQFNGPFARINPLAWDGLPATVHREPYGAVVHSPRIRNNVNSNDPNQDYPNIQAHNVTQSLYQQATGNYFTVSAPSSANLPAAQGPADKSRSITPVPVQVQVNVPKYQPANLQLYGRNGSGNAPILPSQHAAFPLIFPMGYITTERVYASDNGQYNDLSAYRDIEVYTGVPVDMNTSISNQVTDVGVVPHGFGVQMGSFLAASGYGPAAFTPRTVDGTGNLFPGFQGHFQPLTIYNNGNTNLVDPHLDQKVQYIGTNQSPQNAPVGALPLTSDSLDTSIYDPLSYIPAFDAGGARTGPRGPSLGGALGIPEQPYLLRSSLDTDLANAYGIQTNLAYGLVNPAVYPVVTFHKPRVADGLTPNFPGTVMTVPDVPHGVGSNSPPMVSVAVPLGTPAGTYSQTVRLFEGFDVPLDPLIGPLYTGVQGGFAPFDPTQLDTFRLAVNATGVPSALQPYSEPGTQVKVTVQEARLTDGLIPGALTQIDAKPVNGKGAADFLPAAFRDPTTGNLSLYWTTSRDYVPGQPTPPYGIAGVNLGFNGQGSNQYYVPDASNQYWWTAIAPTTPGDPTIKGLVPGSNIGWSVAVDQPVAGNLSASDKTAFGFDLNVTGSGTQNVGLNPATPALATSQTSIYCYQLDPKTGKSKGGSALPVPVVNSPLPKSGVHGLKFTGVSFADPNKGNAITQDLWAFWTGGTRGRTALYYSSAASGDLAGYTSNGQQSPFGGQAVLPVPAGLSSVSDPTAVLTFAPDPTQGVTGTSTPVIEVTYSGTGPTGAASVYVSRYRPYHPAAPNGAVNNGSRLLALLPFRQLAEQLQPSPGSPWWQARDVGWLRNGALNVSTLVTVNGSLQTPQPQSLLLNTGVTNPDGTHPLLAGVNVTYDRASGLLVYTGVSLPKVGGTNPGQTVYVDVNSGRVRFSLPLPGSANGTTTTTVLATFNPTARRITTDPVADTAPVAFLDETYQAPASGVGPNVQADRYWFLWHKLAVANATPPVSPSLWYKTQRLTVAFTDSNGLPLPIQVVAAKPQVKVTFSGGTLYDPANGGVADVDATRGRLYFPITDSGLALEGQTVTITGKDANGNSLPATAVVHWLDEPRFNDASNQVGADSATGVQPDAVNDGTLVPIQTIKNESGITAFLDPTAYLNTSSAINAPHNIWLFWNSTRNGTSDIFYETINPRFNPVIPASGAP